MHIYGPQGLAQFVETALMASDTYVGVPVIIYEFVPGPVSEEELTPRCLNDRTRVHLVCSLLGTHFLPVKLTGRVLRFSVTMLLCKADRVITCVQARVPADRYHPQGYTDVHLTVENYKKREQLFRHARRANNHRERADSRVSRANVRNNWRPAELPEPGDPAASSAPAAELTWTLRCDNERTVRS